METYFWSFVFALFVFFLGGVGALFQGVHRILSPQPIVSPAINLGVLLVCNGAVHVHQKELNFAGPSEDIGRSHRGQRCVGHEPMLAGLAKPLQNWRFN